ncbi:hypothetical protein CMUST_14250 [Corynebacterium mustelae]|uniref:Uncharacterized protein n=1 Tax=Corynebacterium mustelae TaxID=571915 RepID=A0A0G3H5Q3_9CORY|nr:hypothetical protein CMUST_14250 [Corynebacterium mustelae]
MLAFNGSSLGSVVWYEVGDSKTSVVCSHFYLRFCGELSLVDASQWAISDLTEEDGRYIDQDYNQLSDGFMKSEIWSQRGYAPAVSGRDLWNLRLDVVARPGAVWR